MKIIFTVIKKELTDTLRDKRTLISAIILPAIIIPLLIFGVTKLQKSLMDKEKFMNRKELLFDQLNIHEFSKKRISQLSTGMKQKVSIARSMIHDPSVVIFDEPTSGLDVITAHNIIELIKQCKQEGKTIIFSSHIMSEVDLLCDDLAIISRGNLIFNDTMENFRSQSSNQSLTEAFIQIVKENSTQPVA